MLRFLVTLGIALIPIRGSAQVPGSLRVTTGRCMEADALRQEVLAHSDGVAVAVSIEVECSDPLRVHIEVGANDVESRELEVPLANRDSLAEAVALIVAVAAEQWIVEHPPAPADVVPEHQHVGLAGSVPYLPTPARPSPRPAPSQRHSISIGLGAALIAGLLPEISVGGELSLSWRPHRVVSLEASSLVVAEREAQPFDGRVRMRPAAGRLGLCAGAPVGAMRIGGCGGVLGGVLRSQAEGFNVENRTRRDGFISLELRARAQLELGAERGAFVRLDAFVGSVLYGPALLVHSLESASSPSPEVIEVLMGPWYGGTGLMVGVHFAP